MPDAIIFQHYEVLVREDGTPWELGRGAMGVTYKALDTNLRVPVALKVIHPRQLDSELVAQRFVREARAAARLRHPHIAAVYHLGQQAENWFYAMEFVAGDTAEALVKRDGPLPEPVALTLAVQAARALNAAAALGLVHRDIKPSNLMLARESDEWQLKLIDFGLARTFTGSEADEDLAAVTHSGFVGTPYYASPEQLEQKELDIRSDIYSLGVTLWFLLTGKVPFTGSVVSVLSQHLHKAPPFEQLDGVASAATRQLLRRMLEKDPAARPQSALELRRDLEQCEAALPGTPARPTPALTSTPAPPTLAPPTADETAETIVTPVAAAPSPIFTPGESHFDTAETVAEFGFGQLCRARERTSGEDFAVLRLGPQRGLDDAALAHLRETVQRAQRLDHPQVWKIHALESDAEGLCIVMAWADGYVWRDLLRRRRELEPAEAFQLLEPAARGIDAILAAGIDRPDVSLAGLWCEAASPETPPANVKVSPLGLLRAVSLDATWIGEGTLTGPAAAGSEAGCAGAIRAFAQVAYETLGGVVSAPGFPPLATLSEAANKILRSGLRDAANFASTTDFITQLQQAQFDPVPLAPVQERAIPTKASGATAADPPPMGSAAEQFAAQIAPAPLEVAVPSASAVPSGAASPPTAPRELSDEDDAEAEHERAAIAVEDWPVPPRTRGRGLMLAAALMLLAGGATYLLLHPPGGGETTATHSPLSAPQSKLVGGAEPTTPTIPAKPPDVTPAPIVPEPMVAVTARATPPPVTPMPARDRRDLAEQYASKQQWKSAVDEWFAYRKDHPATSTVADLGLLRVFSEVRWRSTRRSGRDPEVTRSQATTLLPEAEKAATELKLVSAMLFLAQHYGQTANEWPRAVTWYEKAGPTKPIAYTRLGRLLVNKDPSAESLSKAWKRFNAAADAGDPSGKMEVGIGLYYGELTDEKGKKYQFPELQGDKKNGVQRMYEVLSETKLPPPVEAFEDVEPTTEDLARLRVILGRFYLDQLILEEKDREPWLAAMSLKPTPGEEMRDLLETAAPVCPEAYDFLAVAAINGIGGRADPDAAVDYWRKGVALKDGGSLFHYAKHLGDKREFAKMPEEARNYMMEAARKKEPEAVEFMRAAASQGAAEAIDFWKVEEPRVQRPSPPPKSKRKP